MLPPHTIVGIDGNSIIGTSLVHWAAESARHLDRVRLVVGRVVEDLLAVNGLDPGAQPGGDDRERVVAPARVHPADEQRRAALLGGLGEALDPLRRCRTRVVERVQRRRHHMLAGAQAALDVVDRLVRTDVAGGHVGDGVAAGQCGVDVGRRRDARSASSSRANVAASLPSLSGDDVMTPDSRNPGKATADRIAVAPIFPVPHTATRSTRITLSGARDEPHRDRQSAAQTRVNCGFGAPANHWVT